MVFVLNSNKGERKKLQRFQNRALRVCTLSSRYTSNLNLHKACKVIPIDLRCKLDLLILMHKRLHHGSEVVVSARDTRQNSAPVLAICRPRSEGFVKSTSYLGPQLWNALHARVRQIRDLQHYKREIRSEINREFAGLTSI